MRLVLRATTRLHAWLYWATGGRIGGHVKARIMLLTITGRRTGKARTTPVSYVASGNDIAVCGANLGSDHHPAWVWNIQRDPHVRVTIGRHTHCADCPNGRRRGTRDIAPRLR
jgi:deazaflavin-dependent oxidoreductase (nitroreductase family)